MRVVAAAGRAKAAPPPIQPTAAALWALLPSTTAVQLHRLYQGESRDTIREWGIAQITPGRHPAEWKQPSREGALRCVALVGCTVHEAHLAAAAAITAHDGVQRVTAPVCCRLSTARKTGTRRSGNNPPRRGPRDAWPWWVARSTRLTLRPRPPSQRMMPSSGSRRWCTSREAAKRSPQWRPCCRLSTSLAVPGTSLQGMVWTERQPWETASPEVVDPTPPGHVLQLVWERHPEDDEQEAAELPDVDSAPLDLLPSTVKVVCVLDPAVLADAHVHHLHVGAFGKDHAWRHLRPLMGATLPHPPPMQAAVRGSRVEVLADLLTELVPLVMRSSGKARGVHFRPWIVMGAACQHPAYVLWYKQPPERRGPSPEVWKTLADDQELQSLFTGLVDGGAPGNVGLRVWGIKPENPTVVAHWWPPC